MILADHRHLPVSSSFTVAADRHDEQHAAWPEEGHRVMEELGHADGRGMTRAMLYERAQELDVRGRSTMSRDELKEAVLQAYRERGEGLSDRTKEELYDRAQELEIEGRSTMTKEELVEAIRDRAE